MRKLLFLIALIICDFTLGFAVKSVKVLPTGGAPVPIAYSVTDTKSLVLTGLAGKMHVLVLNDTTDKIALNVDAPATTISPGSNVRDVYVNAAGSAAYDNISIGDRIYLRSDSGVPITAGTIYIMTW